MSKDSFTLNPEALYGSVDERTIGVVGIMGNHWSGHFDPIAEINQVLKDINTSRQWQVGIHVDAASGGFIAPFLEKSLDWDFSLDQVLSISTSGHKYGEACAGTGWIFWRQRQGLGEYVVTDVTYLGGSGVSDTLNFSRPASGVISQYYNFLHKGIAGYTVACEQTLACASKLRCGLLGMTYQGKPRFQLLDNQDLPVVAMCLNPACELSYNDIDLQHAISMHQWYVSGYELAYFDPSSGEKMPVCLDVDMSMTMFRVVGYENTHDGRYGRGSFRGFSNVAGVLDESKPARTEHLRSHHEGL